MRNACTWQYIIHIYIYVFIILWQCTIQYLTLLLHICNRPHSLPPNFPLNHVRKVFAHIYMCRFIHTLRYLCTFGRTCNLYDHFFACMNVFQWLKKQAEARHLSGFNEPDLRPEVRKCFCKKILFYFILLSLQVVFYKQERDPDWLLQKGRSLMKADCHLGAVSAFSLGIKLAPKIPQLYSERAKAHLHLRNFMKVVDDSSVVRDFVLIR